MTQSFEENVEKVIWKEKKYYPWEIFGISFSNFILHMAFIKILPNNPWPFLFMATFMVLYFKNSYGEFTGHLYSLSPTLMKKYNVYLNKQCIPPEEKIIYIGEEISKCK